jgi:hypothetical protein
MFLRTFIASLAAYFLSIIFVGLFTAVDNVSNRFSYFVQIIFYGLPVWAIAFVFLLLLNLLLLAGLQRKFYEKLDLPYWMLGATISLFIVLGFTFFDYLGRDRYFEEVTFFSLFLKYSSSLLIVAVMLLLNRWLVWKNYKERYNLNIR